MKRNYNITVLAFHADANAVKYFEQSLVLALRSIGCKVNYITRADWTQLMETDENPFEHEAVSECDIFISFNNLDTKYDIFDRLGKPLISICVDRPYHMKWSFDNKAANVLYLWSDENDLKYAPSYFRGGIHKFLPHAAEINPAAGDGLLLKQRDINVLVSCNYYARNQLDVMDAYTAFSGLYATETVDAVKGKYAEGGVCLEDCVSEVTNWNGEDLLDFMRIEGMAVDAGVRLEKKYKTVKALAESGINIDCCGAFWESSGLTAYPNFLYRGYTLYPDFQQMLERAKILVNIFPVSVASAHERIFGSMARGALCLTDPTDWLREHFTDGESIVFYDPKNPQSLTEKIAFYLSHEEERLRVTKNAMEIALREHTWLTRAEEMLRIYERLTGYAEE